MCRIRVYNFNIVCVLEEDLLFYFLWPGTDNWFGIVCSGAVIIILLLCMV